jgi:hypothetical protein
VTEQKPESKEVSSKKEGGMKILAAGQAGRVPAHFGRTRKAANEELAYLSTSLTSHSRNLRAYICYPISSQFCIEVI